MIPFQNTFSALTFFHKHPEFLLKFKNILKCISVCILPSPDVHLLVASLLHLFWKVCEASYLVSCLLAAAQSVRAVLGLQSGLAVYHLQHSRPKRGCGAAAAESWHSIPPGGEGHESWSITKRWNGLSVDAWCPNGFTPSEGICSQWDVEEKE